MCWLWFTKETLQKKYTLINMIKILDPQRLQAQDNPPFSSCLFLFHGKPKLSRHNHRHELLPAMKCGHEGGRLIFRLIVDVCSSGGSIFVLLGREHLGVFFR